MTEPRAKPLCWITGAAGLIGNYLVQTAPQYAAGWNVRGLTRSDIDLLDFQALRLAFRRDTPQLVIHCAALTQTLCKPCSVPALFRVHHRARKEVRLAFNPTGDINELRAQAGVDAADIARGVLVVNTFVGVPVYAGLESVPLLDGLALEIDPLYWHLKHVICAGDLDATRYLCRWLAYILQYRNKSEIVPVLIGGHGTGKSMFVKKLAQMFGNHFYPMQNPQVRRAQIAQSRHDFTLVAFSLLSSARASVLCRMCSCAATNTSAPSSCSATSCDDST